MIELLTSGCKSPRVFSFIARGFAILGLWLLPAFLLATPEQLQEKENPQGWAKRFIDASASEDESASGDSSSIDLSYESKSQSDDDGKDAQLGSTENLENTTRLVSGDHDQGDLEPALGIQLTDVFEAHPMNYPVVYQNQLLALLAIDTAEIYGQLCLVENLFRVGHLEQLGYFDTALTALGILSITLGSTYEMGQLFNARQRSHSIHKNLASVMISTMLLKTVILNNFLREGDGQYAHPGSLWAYGTLAFLDIMQYGLTYKILYGGAR